MQIRYKSNTGCFQLLSAQIIIFRIQTDNSAAYIILLFFEHELRKLATFGREFYVNIS